MTLTPGPGMWSSFLLFSSLILSPLSWSLNLSYVSPHEKQQLELDFAEAKSEIPSEISGSWTCDLIGVRSGLLKEKSIVLYDLKRVNSKSVQNLGASPSSTFSSFTATRPEMIGRGPKVVETLRFLSPNKLISSMVSTKTNQKLAYSRCIKSPKSLTKSFQTNDTVASHD